MVPKFSSQTDMIGFIRAVPKNANYVKMLQDDFNIVGIPADAPAYQKEYLWKYLVQGTYLGKPADELMKYAVEGVEKLVKTLSHLKGEPEATVEQKTIVNVIGKKSSRRKMTKRADGFIEWDDKRKTFIGWCNGKIASSCTTIEKTKARLTRVHGITVFIES